MGTATKCGGKGTCSLISAWAAVAKDADGQIGGYTYGGSNTQATWDKDSIQGCYCTRDYYRGPFSQERSDVVGYDCSKYECPKGDDQRTTGQVQETQTVKCIADGGTFTVTFRDGTSGTIAHNANAATVQSTISEMSR